MPAWASPGYLQSLAGHTLHTPSTITDTVGWAVTMPATTGSLGHSADVDSCTMVELTPSPQIKKREPSKQRLHTLHQACSPGGCEEGGIRESCVPTQEGVERDRVCGPRYRGKNAASHTQNSSLLQQTKRRENPQVLKWLSRCCSLQL